MSAPCSNICYLADDVLLKIISYLSSFEVYNLSKINSRLNSLCFDRSIVRHSNFEGSYALTKVILKDYINRASERIESLNLSHCYWIPGQLIETVCSKCKHLQELVLIDCNTTSKRICKIIGGLNRLRRLGVSVTSIQDLSRKLDACEEAQNVVAQLESLCIHLKHDTRNSQQLSVTIHVMQQLTLFEHCKKLRKLSILGTPHIIMPRDLFRPLILKLDNLRNIEELSINDVMDPAARMFFFGMLLEVCKLDRPFKTLLKPAANLSRLQSKPQFAQCFSHIGSLVNLDLSRADLEFPNPVLNLDKAHNMKYLNLAGNLKITSQQLLIIAQGCPNLVSLNLLGCHFVLCDPSQESIDESGLKTLLETMTTLQHLNMADIHVHSRSLCELVSNLKGLRTLALPVCCLSFRESEPELSVMRSGNKRLLVSYSTAQGFPKRRRIGIQSMQWQSMPSTSTDSTNHPPEQRELDKVVDSCPNVREFELTASGLWSVFNRHHAIHPKMHGFTPCSENRLVEDADLVCISRWRHLHSLSLSGLQGLHVGDSLVTIAQSCQNLEKLYLAYLGLSGHFTLSPTLIEAFKYLLRLKDFRLEHPTITLNEVFFKNLQHCVKLERVCVISKHSTFRPEHVMRLMDELKNLVVVQLFTANAVGASKKLETALTNRFEATRPSVSVTICPLLHDSLQASMNNVPIKHYEELTLLNSSICSKPPGWQHY